MVIRVLHITLALLVLTSSIGVIVNKHYCGGELKSAALFAKAKPCHQDKRMKSCPIHGTMPMSNEDVPSEKNCCDSETDYLKVDEDQVEISWENNLANSPTLLAVLSVVAGLDPIEYDGKTNQYLYYKPPLLVCDLPVRLQTFLC